MSYPMDVNDVSTEGLLEVLSKRMAARVVEQSPYDLYRISRTNRERCNRWHDGAEPWTASDWSNALAGEVGELCNIVKKIRRHETGAVGSYNTPEMATLREQLADEIADVFPYLDLVAKHFRLNLYECIAPKFNRVSEAQGFPERLDHGTPGPASIWKIARDLVNYLDEEYDPDVSGDPRNDERVVRLREAVGG